MLMAVNGVPSTAPGHFTGGNVNSSHLPHCIEYRLCCSPVEGSHGVNPYTQRDLPQQGPFVVALAASTLLPAAPSITSRGRKWFYGFQCIVDGIT
jgi:hypothetical protein